MTAPPAPLEGEPQRWMRERFRPQFHYTAEKNMINDPNGLVWIDGVFHLFHQYNQHEVVHWGHAVSTDLMHWSHREPAIHPDVNGQIYSGTAVVDERNTSRLAPEGTAPVVAFFTHADHHDGTQSQGIAYSTDHGETWTMHPGNPIIPNPGQKDFRDPKVFWHTASDSWVLVVTGGDHLEFFRSPDLLTWTHAFSWGAGHGSHGGVWECPDLFELPVDGAQTTRWVVSVSVDRGAPAGGSGMQYFTGWFDGYSFVNDNEPDVVLWQNWGKDFYAGITWENVPAVDGRRLMIAWADNWLYRFDIPTHPFNGQLTIVQELTLRQIDGRIRLVHRPARELALLRGEPVTRWDPRRLDHGTHYPPSEVGDSYEVVAVFETGTATEFGLDLRVGPRQHTRIGYDLETHSAFIDRHESGVLPHPDFAGRHSAPIEPDAGSITFHILVDRSSVEVFVNDQVQLTDLVLPDPGSTGLRPFAVDGHAVLKALTVVPLRSIWTDRGLPDIWPVTGEWATTHQGVQGSSTTEGMTMVAGGHTRFEVEVTILGTRHGNPTSLLGQSTAGIIADYDSHSGSGIALVANHASQRIEILQLPAMTVLHSHDRRISPNTPVRLRMDLRLGRLRPFVDDVLIDVHPPINAGGGARGYCVADAEARFVRVHPPGGWPAG